MDDSVAGTGVLAPRVYSGNKNLSLEDVPFFNRPMTSGPNDKWTGQKDEAGNLIYETPLGAQYSVAPAADQRTTRQKIEEDVVPSIQEYLEDPTMPSAKDVLSFGIETAKGAYESLKGAVEGTGTYGDVFGFAGGTGAASSAFEIPEGALRIFGGKSAKNFDQQSLNTAETLRNNGVSEQEIWEKTGWYFDPDENAWQFEVSSSGMKLDPLYGNEDVFLKALRNKVEGFINKNENNIYIDKGKATEQVISSNLPTSPITKVIQFPNLFDAYPQLETLKVRFDPKAGFGGSFNQRENLITVGTQLLSDKRRFREVLLHELQHGVQAVEGTTGGSNEDWLLQFDNNFGRYTSPDPEIQKLADRYQKTADTLGIDHDVSKEMLAELQRFSYLKYLADLGERQARAAGRSDIFTDEFKKYATPGERYRTQDLYWEGDMSEPEIELEKLRPVPKMPVGRYAEGGIVSMENQMTRLMQEGGMADDGMDVDPVSGNEIPPGSMASEVRDDIDAKLSEGEYVVPADVVQYYGVKFFEDLRSQAKQGLQEMEQNGRIGGEPVTPDMDEELTPEEAAMLAEVLGESPVGMAEGGLAQGQFNFGQYGYGTTGTQVPNQIPQANIPQTQGTESREYINTDTGQRRIVLFINGQPISPVPEGFVPATPEAIKKAQQGQELLTTPGARGPEPGMASGQEEGAPEAPDYSAMTDAEVSKAIEGNKAMEGIVSMMGLALGPIGGIASRAAKHNTAQAVNEGVKRGLLSEDEAKDISSSKFSLLSPVVEGVKKAFDTGRDSAISIGRDLSGYEAAAAAAGRDPTGQTTGKGLTVSEVDKDIESFMAPPADAQSPSSGSGSSSGASSSAAPSGDKEGEMWNKGGLVKKKTRPVNKRKKPYKGKKGLGRRP